MEIPYNRLSPEALKELVVGFVTREGTDYGDVEVSLDVKVSQIMEQIKNGLAVIIYDPNTQECGIFPKE